MNLDEMKTSFAADAELFAQAPGEIVRSEALARIDAVLDEYNTLIGKTFVRLVETELIEL